MDMIAFWLTARVALATTATLAVLGVPLAYWLATTKAKIRTLIEVAVAKPLVLPPTVLGYYLLAALAPTSRLGAAYAAVFGSPLTFSFSGILLGSVLYNLPFAVRPFAAAFAGVDRKLSEAAWCLGASPLRTFVRVVLPLAWPGVLAGLVLTFAHTVGEFGIVLMLGGNIEGVTRTLSLVLYDDVQALNYAAANQTAAVLLAVAFAALCSTYALQKKGMPL